MIFNHLNTEWETGERSLILGQRPALLDSINRKHHRLFELYKEQKAVDWGEDELDLESSRIDFLRCPKEVSAGMVENLSFQWEGDSIAANAMISVLAPFITDDDFKLSVAKNSDLENVHALTYAEIVRLAVPDPKEVIKGIMRNEDLTERMSVVTRVLEEAQRAGCQYLLGQVENDQSLYNKAFMALVAFYCLERLQFMASFAHTFAIVKQGWFQVIGSYVQKIMQDEYYYHCKTMEYAIRTELKTKRGALAYMELREDISKVLNEVLQREYAWNEHVFSICATPGSNLKSMNAWVDFNAAEVFDLLSIEKPFEVPEQNPLPYMKDWLDIDRFQTANQDVDNNNYSLNSMIMDIPEDHQFEYY